MAAFGLGPRTSSPAFAPFATAPAALDGTDDVALALRVADDTDLINAVTIDTGTNIPRLTSAYIPQKPRQRPSP